MKLLFITQSVALNRPGPEAFVYDWIMELSRHFEFIEVLTYYYDPLSKLPGNVRVQVISDGNRFSRTVSLFFKALAALKDCDAVFAHILEIFGIAAGVAGLMLRKKSFFWYCQGYDLSKNFLAKLAFAAVGVIFTCSEEVKNRYCRETGLAIKDKIKVVGHGINLSRYHLGQKLLWPGSGQPYRILYAGRISPIKDLTTLIKAMILLNNKGRKYLLDIKGGWGLIDARLAVYKKEIERLMQIANKDYKMITFGRSQPFPYPKVSRIFKNCHIFVVPSLSRAMDKLFLESLACKIPTIGTEIAYPFMKKIVPEFLYHEKDEVDLARKISWVTKNRKSALRLTRKASDYVRENYDLKKLIAAISERICSN
jgi:glycosyltransferase involved in cell wall biosynthesis